MRFFLFLLVLPARGQDPTPALTAERLIEAGHWKQARTIVELRIREAPRDANLTFLLSQIRGAFGGRSAPLILAEKAVALAPNAGRYHRQLAEVQGVMAQRAGAFQQLFLARKFRKEIDAALAADPSDVQAWRDLMEYYLLAPGIVGGDPKKAEATAHRIAAIDPIEGLLALARIAETRKDSVAEEAQLKRAAEAEPQRYKARIALAAFYARTANPDANAAEDAASRALALDATRVAAYALLAAIYAGRADWKALDSILDAAVRNVPDDATPFYRAAVRLLACHTGPSRAQQYLLRYLAQEPEGNQPTLADAHWKLGLACEALGNWTAAVQEWTRALQLDSASPAAAELKRLNRTPGNGAL